MQNTRCGLAVLLIAVAVPSFAAAQQGCRSGTGGACDPAVQKGYDDNTRATQERRAREQESKDLGVSTETVRQMRHNQTSPK